MLRTIQDLKEEYYIGTKVAFNYLKSVRDIYEKPKKVAELINKKLENSGLEKLTKAEKANLKSFGLLEQKVSKMAKESYCPGENLINLVTGVLDFENLDKEPWEFKKSNFVIGDKTLDEFMALSGMDMDEVNKRRVRDYTKREKILSDLLKYGDTKEKILEGLREHVKICLDCSKKYLDYLISYAYCVISLKDIEKEYGHADFLTKGAVKESIEKAKESFKKGIFYILEEGDSKYLNLLDGD